jgi:hypothetical protein
MTDKAQIHALGQELADQPIGILIRAALPRAVRIAEEDVHVQRGTQRLMQRHLRALVVGHGFTQARGHGFEAPARMSTAQPPSSLTSLTSLTSMVGVKFLDELLLPAPQLKIN